MKDDIKLPGSDWWAVFHGAALYGLFSSPADAQKTLDVVPKATGPVPMYTGDQLRAAVLADRATHHSSLTARVAELEAHLRTIANFGGTLDQARDLAAKGMERGALLAKGES